MERGNFHFITINSIRQIRRQNCTLVSKSMKRREREGKGSEKKKRQKTKIRRRKRKERQSKRNQLKIITMITINVIRQLRQQKPL